MSQCSDLGLQFQIGPVLLPQFTISVSNEYKQDSLETTKRCNTIWMASHPTTLNPQDSVHTYQQRLHHLDVVLGAGTVQRCLTIHVLYA